MTRLWLVRHGETEWNRARRIQGATDIPLNGTGRDQARRAGELLRRRPVDAVVASPLVRAAETGAIVAELLGLPEPRLVPALAERRYGVAEGLTPTEVEARFPDGARVPGRESRGALLDRVLPALEAIAADHVGGSVVVATHGAVIRTVVSAVAPDHRAAVGVPIRNGSVHSFEVRDAGLRLRRFDDPLEDESEEHAGDPLAAQNALEGAGDA
ncbi:histidine phosphatase family protein [Frigoribacterium salinisoli]